MPKLAPATRSHYTQEPYTKINHISTLQIHNAAVSSQLSSKISRHQVLHSLPLNSLPPTLKQFGITQSRNFQCSPPIKNLSLFTSQNQNLKAIFTKIN